MISEDDSAAAAEDARGRPRRRAAPHPRSSVPGYMLAGKTGTAQKVVDGTYSDTQFVASFVGFAPAEDPKLLRRGHRRRPEGRLSTAAPSPPRPSARSPSFALPYLGIAPTQMSRVADRRPACSVPRIACDEAATAHSPAFRGRHPHGRRLGPRSPTSPSTAAPSSPGTLFFCVRGDELRRPRLRAARSRPAPRLSSSSASSTSTCRRLLVAGHRARAMARWPRAFRRSQPRSCGWSGSPAPTARRRRPS